MSLEEVLDEIYADYAGAAAHPGEVIRHDVFPHLVPVHDPRRQRRRGREERDVDNEDVDLRRRDPGFCEEAV